MKITAENVEIDSFVAIKKSWIKFLLERGLVPDWFHWTHRTADFVLHFGLSSRG